MADKKRKTKAGFGGRIRKYFRDTASEFKKIVWPSKKQIWNNVGVVLTTVVIFAIILWALDFGLGALRNLMINELPKLGAGGETAKGAEALAKGLAMLIGGGA